MALPVFCCAQSSPFKNIDFSGGEYCMMGVRSESDRNSLADSLGNWYTEDISVLNDFKKNWVFEKKSPMYACGYHYHISVYRKKVLVTSFSVNLNCNEIATDEGYFYFDAGKLRIFKGRLNKVYIKHEKPATLLLARARREELLKNPDVIDVPGYLWVTYEGSFRFTYTYAAGESDTGSNEEKILSRLTREIQKAYPGEKFELHDAGGSLQEMYVEADCNRSLENKFTLFKRDNELDAWQPNTFDFYAYWKIKPE